MNSTVSTDTTKPSVSFLNLNTSVPKNIYSNVKSFKKNLHSCLIFFTAPMIEDGTNNYFPESKAENNTLDEAYYTTIIASVAEDDNENNLTDKVKLQ